jgi:hypothetical protein
LEQIDWEVYMKVKTIAGFITAIVALVIVILGGTTMGVVLLFLNIIGLYEFYHIFELKGHKPIKWRNSYKSSISKWAVKKGTVKNAELGKWLSLEKAKLEKGEYVLVIETKSDLSINAYGSNYDNVTLFVGGKEENGCLKIRARYKSA